MKKPITRITLSLLAAAVVAVAGPPRLCEALNTLRLDQQDTSTLHAILAVLDPRVKVKQQDGTAAILTWDELYEPLNADQRSFIDEFRQLKASELGATNQHFDEVPESIDYALVPVEPQTITKSDVETPVNPQFLPRRVLQAYQKMMDAMEADLGTRLRVESGYRSPAYQLYLFIFYMPKHDYSVTETNRHVALPGHSEHGHPPRQAIDFINEAGINGEDNPAEFDVLPEFAWLQENAKRFGFTLSYPKDNPDTAYEPWHWRYGGAS